MIETIFTYKKYHSITERIPLNFSGSFYTGLYSVRHSPSTIINSCKCSSLSKAHDTERGHPERFLAVKTWMST